MRCLDIAVTGKRGEGPWGENDRPSAPDAKSEVRAGGAPYL
jgi:hypothetical protein